MNFHELSMPKSRSNSGQAIVEFLVSCLVLIPIFMGMVYIAKYQDVKHSAIQASRYAAIEYATNTKKKPAEIQQETKVRFFAQQENRNSGHLSATDKSYVLNKNTDQVPFWRDLAGKPLITDFSNVTVSAPHTYNSGGSEKIFDDIGKVAFKLDKTDLKGADVEVALANIKHYQPFSNINLKVGATTVYSGNAWNANGNDDVKKHMDLGGAISVLSSASSVIDFVVDLFEASGGPKLGCINPNVVPNARLQNNQNYAPCQ
jgi:hypothetical protein